LSSGGFAHTGEEHFQILAAGVDICCLSYLTGMQTFKQYSDFLKPGSLGEVE